MTGVMNGVSATQIVGLVTLLFGGGIGVALITTWANRRLNAASVDEKRIESADKVINQLSTQLDKALARIDSLEAKQAERDAIHSRLWRRIGILEKALRENGIPIPPDDEADRALIAGD